MERRQRSGRLKKAISAALAAIFAVLIFPVSSASAASGLFEIQSVELTDLSATASGSVANFGGTNISSSLTFGKLNDTAKYTITIKNTDDKNHIIENITDDNASQYISYKYDSHAGENVDAGANLTLVVTVKYVSYIPDASEGSQASSVKFQIHFTDYVEEIVIAPDTGDDVNCMVLSLAASVICLTVLIFAAFKRHKKAGKIIAAIATIVAAAATTSVVKAAAAETSDFALAISFTLAPGRLIHYDGNWPDDGEMADSYWTADGILKPNAYIVEGYHFTGWSLEPDEEVVYNDKEPMSNIPDDDEPLTLYAFWEPNTYTIYFHANSEYATSSMAPLAAEYDKIHAPLPYNEFIWEGHRFIGWKVNNEGRLISDGASAGQFVTEHGGTVNLYAQWEVTPVGIDYYKNSDEAVGITQRQENFGSTTSLNTPNYHRDGYGFAGWNTEPDGTGTMYGPNEYVVMPSDGLKLYATWVKAEEGVTMQSFDSSAEPYASRPNGTVIALKDIRDNQVYTVAKLPDGKWWMTENLRLVPAGMQLTAENTNNPAQAAQNVISVGSLCTDETTECINRFAYNASNLTASGGSKSFAYGNGVYYNVFTATAGHAAVDLDNPVNEQVAGDICPKGWHLPTSGRDGDIRTLDVALGGTGDNTVGDLGFTQKYFKAPINFVAGGWGEGYMSYMNIGSEAVYLESGTNGLRQSASSFTDDSTSINNFTVTKYTAHTIRCIAK